MFSIDIYIDIGSKFQVPRFIIYQAMVEALEAVDHVTEANEWFQKVTGKLRETVDENDQENWVFGK